MPSLDRRTFLTAGTALPLGLASADAAGTPLPAVTSRRGRIRQSVVHWCFRPMTVAALAEAASRLGIGSVELVAPEHWPLLRSLGLTCAIAGSHGFARGFAHREEHAECSEVLRRSIDAAAEAGIPSVITFSGFRRGLSTAEGRKNMIDGLGGIVGHAERRGVTLCLEMLNSRVDAEMKGHPDYFCDDIDLAVEICREVGSPRLRVLFDIYHVQIMHGDVITRIRRHAEWIGHVHTAGVPGRGELDDRQELNYPPILRALAESGYRGWVGHEFIPTGDPLAGLAAAAALSDV